METKLKQRFNGLEINPSASLWQHIESELPEGDMEQKIRAQLNDAELKPSERFWDNLSSELPGTNEGPSFRYWGLTTVLGVLLVAAIGYVFSVNQQNQPVAVSQSNRVAVSPEVPQKSDAPVLAQRSSATRNATPAVIQLSPTASEQSAPAARQPSSSAHSAASTAPTDNRAGKVTSQNPIKSTDQVATKPQPLRNNLTPQESYTLHSEPSQTAAITQENNLLPIIPDGQKNLPDSDKQPLQVMQEPALKSTAESNTVEIGIKQVNTEVAKSDSAIPQAPIPVSVLTGEEELTPFSITATAGINYSMMRLAMPASSLQYPLAENKALRESIEKPSVDFAFSFLVDYKLNDRIRISAGIGRVIFNQSFSYNVASPVVVPTNTENNANMTFASDSIVQGDAYNQTIRYTWTEIPVLITWSFKSKTKWQLGIQGGFSYAMLSTVQANMVNYDNVGILVLNEKSSFPGFQNHVFALLNPTLAYRWKPDVEFMLQPSIRYAMNSMVENSNWVQQYPVLLGLNVAMRKRF
jgi:hypothetical protein